MVMDVAMTVGNAAICLGMSGCSARAGTVGHMGGHVDFILAPVSGTGTGFGPLPSREGDMWLVCLVVTLPCGYCLKASMTGLAQPVLPSGLRIKSAMT